MAGTERQGRRPSGAGGVPAAGLRRRIHQHRLRRRLQGPEESLLHPRSRGADPDQRLGRCVGVGAECLGGRRQERRRCRRRRQFRPRAQAAPGREGRRPQLPGHVECGRFASRLDARHGRHRTARCLRRREAARPAAARGVDRRGAIWRDAYGSDQGRPLRAGRRLSHGRRRGPSSGGFGSFSSALASPRRG
jgi:hypothetical protein